MLDYDATIKRIPVGNEEFHGKYDILICLINSTPIGTLKWTIYDSIICLKADKENTI